RGATRTPATSEQRGGWWDAATTGGSVTASGRNTRARGDGAPEWESDAATEAAGQTIDRATTMGTEAAMQQREREMTQATGVDRLSRRAMLVGTLRTGAYVAPAIVSASLVAPVAAATPPPCTQPVTLAQDAVLYNAAPNFTYNVLLQPNGTGPF